MKTAVTFLCHVVNDETIFRYNHLKEGCRKMGYDLWWILDCGNEVGTLPPGIDFFTASFENFKRELPFAVHFDYMNLNATPGLVLQFHNHHHGKYDRIWVIEYDVCFLGEWEDFFGRYEDSDSDLIAADIKHWSEFASWSHFKQDMPDWQFKKMKDELPLHMSLNCCSRVSSRLLDDILRFLKCFKSGSKFFEWVWITVAKAKEYEVLELETDQFTWKQIGKNFSGFKPGFPYHAVKLDINWGEVMSKYCK